MRSPYWWRQIIPLYDVQNSICTSGPYTCFKDALIMIMLNDIPIVCQRFLALSMGTIVALIHQNIPIIFSTGTIRLLSRGVLIRSDVKMAKIKRWKIYNINLGHMYLYDILFWLSFYNFYRNGSHWSTDGCVVTQTGENFTNCRCNHLTNFAILVRPYQTVKSYFHIFFKLYSPFF